MFWFVLFPASVCSITTCGLVRDAGWEGAAVPGLDNAPAYLGSSSLGWKGPSRGLEEKPPWGKRRKASGLERLVIGGHFRGCWSNFSPAFR